MTKHIHRQIDALKQKILYVGTLVEEAIANAISALINRDAVMAQKVIANDSVIDRMEVEVEEECLKILALYQPVANDLRFVVATLKINNDLERMGDLAKNIAKRTAYLAGAEAMELPVDFRGMAMKAQNMVKQSLDALVNADASLARQVRDEDDEVDDSRQRIRRPDPRRDPPHARAHRISAEAEFRFKASGAPGRHGHERRRRRDLHGRGRDRAAPGERVGRAFQPDESGQSRSIPSDSSPPPSSASPCLRVSLLCETFRSPLSVWSLPFSPTAEILRR